MSDQARREFFDFVQKQLASRYKCCLWPGAGCTRPSIRAHSIQNQRVLDVLSDDGHVIMPKLTAGVVRPPRTVFRKVGRHDATTFTGLCASHDQVLFRPVDAGPLDPSNSEHLFLLAYRAVLQEAHATRKAAVDTQTVFLQGAEKGLYPRDEPTKAGLEATEAVGRAYLRREWGWMDHTILRIDAPPSLAANAMISTDLSSATFDSAAYVFLNVCPVEDQTIAIFSYVAADRGAAEAAFGDIWAASGHYQKYLLSKLILRRCSNFVIAPKVFDTLSNEQTELMLTYFDGNIPPRTMDLDDPRLFLFG